MKKNHKVKLAVIITHPIQYQVPIFKILSKKNNVDLKVFFACDHGIKKSFDEEFNKKFQWDLNLLKGYNFVVLTKTRLGNLSNPFKAFFIAKKATKKIKQFNPEFTIISGYMPIFYIFVATMLFRSGQRLIFRADTTDQAVKRSGLKRFIRNGFLKWFYRKFEYFIAVGSNSKDHYLKIGIPESKISVALQSADYYNIYRQKIKNKGLSEKIRRKFGIKRSDFVVLYCGKICYRKNPFIISRAMQYIKPNKRKKVFFLIVGSGNLEKKLVQEARQVFGKNFHFAGFQNQREIGRYYEVCDALVLPSITGETWGLVVNEALQYNKPCVVSSQVGCAKDLILEGMNGYIFDTGSAKDLAQKISLQMDNKIFKKTRLPKPEDTAGAITKYIKECRDAN